MDTLLQNLLHELPYQLSAVAAWQFYMLLLADSGYDKIVSQVGCWSSREQIMHTHLMISNTNVLKNTIQSCRVHDRYNQHPEEYSELTENEQNNPSQHMQM
jgi:hypothetical protein